MKVALTGGAGFIGTNILLSAESSMINFYPSDIVSPRCKDLNQLEYVNLCDYKSLHKWLDTVDPEIIIHLGARTDLRGKKANDYGANIAGVENVCSWLNNNPSCHTALFASTRLVCRIGYQPNSETDYCSTTAYGESKIIGENIVRNAGLSQSWTIFRPTSIWGPWMGEPYDAFFRYVAKGLYLHPKDHKIEKSFGFVGNTVQQIIRLALGGAKKLNGKTIYLADYEQIDVFNWGNEIRLQMGKRPLKTIPFWVLRTAAKLGDILNLLEFDNVPLTSFRLDNLLTNMIHDISEIQSVLPSLPFTHQEGIKMTIDWIKNSKISNNIF
jgi:nucleoside-diphosphate-sugar epimerase